MSGITCCVPGCRNNSIRNRDIRFYVIPKDQTLREKWLKNIKKTGKEGKFIPTSTHRVCSAHFEGGRKTYLGNISTIFSFSRPDPPNNKSLKQPAREANMEDSSCKTVIKFEHSYSIVNNDLQNLGRAVIEKNKVIESMADTIEELRKRVIELEVSNEHKDRELVECKTKLSYKIAECVSANRKLFITRQCLNSNKLKLLEKSFSIRAYKDKPRAIKFYTGFNSYNNFCDLVNFLKEDTQDVKYYSAKKLKEDHPCNLDRGSLSFEEEIFIMLCRLRLGLLEEDLAFRVHVSQSTISRICSSYSNLLSRRFSQISIHQPSREIAKYLPQSFTAKMGFNTSDRDVVVPQINLEKDKSCKKVKDPR